MGSREGGGRGRRGRREGEEREEGGGGEEGGTRRGRLKETQSRDKFLTEDVKEKK